MPKYEVIITRDITESTSVIVFAPDRSEAEGAALESLWNLESADWFVDDNSCRDGDVYVSSVEEMV